MSDPTSPAAVATRRRDNPFTGAIAFENRETVDSRMLAPESVNFKPTLARPIPVMLLGHGPGHQLSTIAGRIDAVSRSDDALVAEGWVTLPPGEYACGVDLRDFESTMLGGLFVVTSARLMGLTVYPSDSGTEPAWPDAKIVVTGRTK